MTDLEVLLRADVKQFIRDHEHVDPQELLLHPPVAFRAFIRLIADQLISRKKARYKLPQWYASEHVIYPPPLSLEQCSSPATAFYKQSLFHGEKLVDLTGGMGIDTLHLSENFRKTTYVEQNAALCTLFQHNSSVLSRKAIQVTNMSAEQFLETAETGTSFFIDPARRDEHQRKVFRFEDCSPDVTDLLPRFQQLGGHVLIKAAPLIDLSLAISSLQYTREIHIVSVKNEVKEVLFLLDFQQRGIPEIICMNLETEQPEFRLTQAEEHDAQPAFASAGRYLYDPNSAILKAGAFKLLATRYGLNKLAPNTHLYSSDQLIDSFPGRIFEILEHEVTKRSIGTLLPDRKANVFTKNHPLKPEALRQQLKITDGGELFVIGYRDLQQKARILLARQVK